MAYRNKYKSKEDNRNLRATHSYIDAPDERLDDMLHESLLIYDQTLYYLRWEYFSCRDCEFLRLPEYLSWFELCDMVAETEAWKNSKLDINVKKQAVKEASDAWVAYESARIDYYINPSKYQAAPKMPNYLYRRKDSHDIVIDKTRFRNKKNSDVIRIPCSKIDIVIPKNLKKEWITEVQLKKVNGRYKVTFTYDYDKRREYEHQQKVKEGKAHCSAVRTNKNKRILSIDLGKVNLVTGMTYGCGSEDTSFVIRGCFMQQRINETCAKISHLQSTALISANEEITKISKRDGQRKIFRCSNEMNQIWSSYNDYIDNQVGNISSMIIDFCVEHRINLLIVGYNEGWKHEIELGKKTNRVFYHMPHGRLIKTLEYKTKEIGLSFMTVEESYTSKCDHLALEDMCHHETYLGKRVKRGMFKSSTGKIVHADVNGCIGMIRKAKVILDAVLIDSLRNRGDVVSPVVLNVRGLVPHKQRSPKILK